MPARFLIPLVLLSFLSSSLQPQLLTSILDPDSSYVAYTGHHPLHSWRGLSHTIHATLNLHLENPTASQVDIRIPVESFDSGNPNRDSNMLDVVEADRFPEVRFVLREATIDTLEAASDSLYQARWRIRGELTFHGITRTIEIPVDISMVRNRFTAHTMFCLKLSDFNVRRPRLLLMPIRDEIDVEVHLTGILPSD